MLGRGVVWLPTLMISGEVEELQEVKEERAEAESEARVAARFTMPIAMLHTMPRSP
jgi:hypothetical protein